jgi:ribosomal protein S18 acetylase RimI-like enzyme
MENLWSMYFKEREGYECIDTGKAVASYKIDGENCYVRDIFVHPDFRYSGEASLVTDAITAIAREKGCKTLTGSCVPSTNGSSLSMYAMLKYGFKLKSSHENFIILVKEI